MYVQVIQLRAEAADARFRATRAEQEVAQKDMEVKQLQARTIHIPSHGALSSEIAVGVT